MSLATHRTHLVRLSSRWTRTSRQNQPLPLQHNRSITASFTLTGTAEVGSTVNLLRGAGTDSLGSATATNGAWTITVTLTDGANTITATATDRAGNTSDATDAVIITLDTGKPAKPAITTTAQSVNKASFTLTGTAEVGSTVNLLRGADGLSWQRNRNEWCLASPSR